MREGNGGRETASSHPGASPRVVHEVPCHHFVDERSQVLTDLVGVSTLVTGGPGSTLRGAWTFPPR